MLSTIWDDINHEAEAIVICDTKYNPGSLSNIVYDVIDDFKKRRHAILTNKVKGLFSELEDIRQHRTHLATNENITMLIEAIFKPEYKDSITDLDRVFLNSYYRKLLRAKTEQDLIGKELVPGLVITEYTNHETDVALVASLRYLRVICRYLGIKSTTEATTFPVEKLYLPAFWSSMSEKFVGLFGEIRIVPIEVDDELPNNNIEAMMLFNTQRQIRQAHVLMFLNIVFNTWSGSTLSFVETSQSKSKRHQETSESYPTMVKVVPATYVTRMLPKLR